MLSTAIRRIFSALFCVYACVVYAETTAPPATSNEPSVFLKNLNINGSTSTVAIKPIADKMKPMGEHPTPLSTASVTQADTKPPLASPAANINTTLQPIQQKQLQAVQVQLQSTLASLQQQSNQLQSSLTLLAQQLARAQDKQGLAPTSPANPSARQLLDEYQQIQSSLDTLRQTQAQLQISVLDLDYQLTALQQQPDSPISPIAAAVTSTAVDSKQANTSTALNIAHPTNSAIPSVNAVETIQTTTTTPSIPAPAAPTTNSISDASTALDPPTPLSPVQKPAGPAVNQQALPANSIAAPQARSSLPPAFSKPSLTVQALPSAPKPKMSMLSWLQDPVNMLRIGASFIFIALLSLVVLLWPKAKQKDKSLASALAEKKENLSEGDSEDKQPDPTPAYDSTRQQETVLASLDLARGYMETGQYAEARAAVQSILEQNTPELQKAAQELLEKIQHAEAHAAI